MCEKLGLCTPAFPVVKMHGNQRSQRMGQSKNTVGALRKGGLSSAGVEDENLRRPEEPEVIKTECGLDVSRECIT